MQVYLVDDEQEAGMTDEGYLAHNRLIHAYLPINLPTYIAG